MKAFSLPCGSRLLSCSVLVTLEDLSIRSLTTDGTHIGLRRTFNVPPWASFAIAVICVFFLLFQESSQLEFLDVRFAHLFTGREIDRWTSVFRWLVLWQAGVCVAAGVGIQPY